MVTVEGSQRVPRAPHPGPLWVLILAPPLLATLLFLPALPAGFVAAELLRRRPDWLRWATLVALATLTVELVWWRESLLLLHLAPWTEGLWADLLPQVRVAAVQRLLWARMICEAPLSIPLGVLGAVVSRQLGERQAAGAPWHPGTVARQGRAEVAEVRRLRKLLENPEAAARCDGPPLAVAREGNLDTWRRGDFVVMPTRKDQPGSMRGKAIAFVGRSGMGKTVGGRRLVATDGGTGNRSAFIDCKGTETHLDRDLIRAWENGAGWAPTFRIWPDQPLDGWRGEPAQLAQRLLAGQSWGREPWWHIMASSTIRMACEAPAGPPRSSVELLNRLTADGLLAAYAGTDQLGEVQRLVNQRQWEGVELRMRNYFAALAGWFDGAWSWGDAEVIFARLNTLTEPEDKAATLGFLLNDFLAWATTPTRKARVGDDLSIYLDEIGAVSADPAVLLLLVDMAERLRDVGIRVVFLGQSLESFGPEPVARRLLSACSARVVMGTDDPEPVLTAAGTTWRPEQSWTLDHHGPTGSARLEWVERPAIDPNRVRQAGVGEAWIISGGRWLHCQILGTGVAKWPTPAAEGPLRVVEGRLVSEATGEGERALRRREGPLVRPDDPSPDGPVGPLPVGPRQRRQLVARVRAGDLDGARELADVLGMEQELVALLAPARRWWRRAAGA